MGLVETVKLTCEDICHHKPHCDYEKGWLNVMVPDYSTYFKAFHWLREIRQQKCIYVNGVSIEPGKYTGEYRFQFLCEQECILFALKWS